MFNIILDPSVRNGCTVWTGDKVSTIKGDFPMICDEIHRRVMATVEYPNGYKLIQVKTIGVDIGGYGRAITDIFDRMGITYTEIRPINIDAALPRLR